MGQKRMHSRAWRTVARLALAASIQAVAVATVSAQTASIPRPVSVDVVWPTTGEVERRDGNGLSIAGGVATVDGSDQYGLRALQVDTERESVSFIYVDAWALDAARPPSCAFTFRHVARSLTQAEANDLSNDLASAEMTRLEGDHGDITEVGHRSTEGAAVTRRVDRFTFSIDDGIANGLSKTWVFVLDGKAYYVNKVCLAPDTAALTVIDQLIGLNYRSGVTPPPSAPAPASQSPASQTPSSPAAPGALSVPPLAAPPPSAPTPASPVPPATAPRGPGWRIPRLRLPHLG
ncbi:hypothetical protein BH10PSE2_BH10PSE2_05130 [soil metagenome]